MKTKERIQVVSRDSRLSLVQVKELFSSFPAIAYELTVLKSYGDKNKHISLMDNIDGDFFTRELDSALLRDEADVAIHSAKDLPYPLPSGLELYCLTAATDKTDSLVSRNNLKLEELPHAAKVGTSSIKRKSELLAIRSDLTIVSIRGTIEERLEQLDRGAIDALIVATCALKRLGLENRIAQILPFKTHPLQGNLAVTGKKDHPKLKAIFSGRDIRKTYGKVRLVGFGPGNPDLLTIGGDQALAKADIIFHDDLIDKNFLNKYKAEKKDVGKRKNKHSYHQDEINDLLYQAAISGKNVVRLKGGDPMIFAHGREEIDFLKSRFVEVEVIPGISSGIALASYTHIPLTHRGVASSVAFVTGHAVNKTSIPYADTLVYYMAGTRIAEVANELIKSGRKDETPVALVHNVSLPDQKTFFSTLKELQFSTIHYPTPILVVVGDVVSFENNKASAQHILLTSTMPTDYKGKGQIIHTPLISIQRNKDHKLLELLEQTIEGYQWIVFTSRYGVQYFFEMIEKLRFDVRGLRNVKIAAVGKTTSKYLARYHLYPDVQPSNESAEGLIECFKQLGLTASRVLLPRSDKGLTYLSEELTRMGNQVVDLPIYLNKENQQIEKTDLTKFGKIIFSSPSGVDAFKKIYGELPEGVQLVAKGKTTTTKIKTELNETF